MLGKGCKGPSWGDPAGLEPSGKEVVEVGPELPLAIPPPIQPPRLCATSSPMDTSNTYRRVSGPQVFICLSGCQIDLALRGPKAWLSASPGNH